MKNKILEKALQLTESKRITRIQSVQIVERTKTRTFEFPDNRKAKQFAKDISNSSVATGTVSGNRVIDVEILRGSHSRSAVAKYMNKNRGKEINVYQESVELGEESKPKQMSPNEKLKIFKKLKPKQEIKIWFDSSMSKGKDWKLFVVKGRSKSAKYNLEKITLQRIGKDGKAGGVKHYFYNRDGKVSFAMGDMAASLISISESFEELAEADEWTLSIDFDRTMTDPELMALTKKFKKHYIGHGSDRFGGSDMGFEGPKSDLLKIKTYIEKVFKSQINKKNTFFASS